MPLTAMSQDPNALENMKLLYGLSGGNNIGQPDPETMRPGGAAAPIPPKPVLSWQATLAASKVAQPSDPSFVGPPEPTAAQRAMVYDEFVGPPEPTAAQRAMTYAPQAQPAPVAIKTSGTVPPPVVVGGRPMVQQQQKKTSTALLVGGILAAGVVGYMLFKNADKRG